MFMSVFCNIVKKLKAGSAEVKSVGVFFLLTVQHRDARHRKIRLDFLLMRGVKQKY